MSTEENKAFMRRYCEEFFNQGKPDPNAAGRVMHRSDHGIRALSSRAGWQGRVTVEDQVAEGDKVVTRWRMEGTGGEWQTPWGTFSGTDKPIIFTWISIDRFENGKVVEAWVESDFLGIAMQVGAIPTPA